MNLGFLVIILYFLLQDPCPSIYPKFDSSSQKLCFEFGCWPALASYPLRHPKYHPIETLKPFVEARSGVLVWLGFSMIRQVLKDDEKPSICAAPSHFSSHIPD